MKHNKTPEIVIIRGIPGSGKSTLAKETYPDHLLCEADQFFYVDGEYKYDSNKIKDAHSFCYKKAKSALENGCNVVVANTFTRMWEMKKYIDLGYPCTIVEATGSYKNIHGVPDDVVNAMRARFERI